MRIKHMFSISNDTVANSCQSIPFIGIDLCPNGSTLENLFDYELKVSEPRLSTRLNCYVCSAEIHCLFNDNTRIFNELAFQVLSDLSLSEKEIGEYEKISNVIFLNGVGDATFGEIFEDVAIDDLEILM